jgi:hypothetical protein
MGFPDPLFFLTLPSTLHQIFAILERFDPGRDNFYQATPLATPQGPGCNDDALGTALPFAFQQNRLILLALINDADLSSNGV